MKEKSCSSKWDNKRFSSGFFLHLTCFKYVVIFSRARISTSHFLTETKVWIIFFSQVLSDPKLCALVPLTLIILWYSLRQDLNRQLTSCCLLTMATPSPPTRLPRKQRKETYNRRHKKGPVVVERGFWILKTRFRYDNFAFMLYLPGVYTDRVASYLSPRPCVPLYLSPAQFNGGGRWCAWSRCGRRRGWL